MGGCQGSAKASSCTRSWGRHPQAVRERGVLLTPWFQISGLRSGDGSNILLLLDTQAGALGYSSPSKLTHSVGLFALDGIVSPLKFVCGSPTAHGTVFGDGVFRVK